MKYMQSNNDRPHIAVIGAGAAGLLAAGTALSFGAHVTLFDQNKTPGKKVLITGKGRCNVTNECDLQEFLSNVPKNSRFLYAALSAFSPEDTVTLFTSLGVPLKTERGKRVFPVSDKAADIVSALKKHAKDAEFISEKVTKILAEENKVIGLRTDKDYFFDAVVLATGGKSYPLTGSDGSGYALAASLGHTVTKLSPSLIPLEAAGMLCKELQGLSLRNIGFKICERTSEKTLYTDFGEMMFTHFGITGPVVISASAHLIDKDISSLDAVIDLKPALDEKTLDKRLISDFTKYKNRDFLNALSDLLPQKLIEPIVRISGIDPRKKVNAITREERTSLLKNLKALRIPLRGTRPISEAIVTSGGISVKEINPKTMMSKLCKDLYFAGEIIDVDAYTGGFNLQIAFSTGYLAAEHAAIRNEDET